MEVTGTNWPMFNTICCCFDVKVVFVARVVYSRLLCSVWNGTAHYDTLFGCCGCVFCSDCGLSVVVSGGVTPGPFPNPEAKPTCADGTAPGRVWESKSPPASKLNLIECVR